MEAELAALAASGASTLVGLMVTDTWEQARDRLTRFFARGGDEEPVEEELGLSRRELVVARQSGDEDVEADIEAGWRTRMRRALQADPQAAEELRQLLAELAPEAGHEPSVSVHNVISGGVQHGPVIQSQNISGLSFHSSDVAPPRRSGQPHDE